MRRSPISRVALAALAALLAGCGGPALRVHSLHRDEGGKVYVKPYRDGENRTLPADTPETFAGEIPTDWEIPRDLLGGRAKVRIEYPDGTRHEADIAFHGRKDTLFRVEKPRAPGQK